MKRPSAHQVAIFDALRTGTGNLLVQAAAGTGKTTTLVEGAKLLPPSARAAFAAFNRHIRDELRQRLSDTPMTASTIHGLGNSLLTAHLGKRPIVRWDKYTALAREWLQAHVASLTEPLLGEFVELLRLARLSLASPDDERALMVLLDRHSLVLPPGLFCGVAQVLRRGEEVAAETGEIDFTDQLWLPYRWDLRPPHLDWLFVDEAQDLSPAGQELVLRYADRYLFVGDPAQSIMGFAGSDSRSFYTIRDRAQASVLPLSVSYRCPRSHVQIARQLVPHIEARSDAPEGKVTLLRERDLSTEVQGGDLVICRTVAPLVSACLRLIRNGIEARVRGENVSDSLLPIVNAVAKRRGFRYEHFEGLLDEYEAERFALLVKDPFSDGRLQALHDRCEAVRACHTEMGKHDLESLKHAIVQLFDERCRNPVWLSTVHRAKGLEGRRVFILEPHRMPLEWHNQQYWCWVQELNVRYVAVTRAKEELVLLQPKDLRVDYRDGWLARHLEDKFLTRGWELWQEGSAVRRASSDNPRS